MERVYGTPVYDENGDLKCRCCGKPMVNEMSGNGDSFTSCTDTGCEAYGFEFMSGSYRRNPSRG